MFIQTSPSILRQYQQIDQLLVRALPASEHQLASYATQEPSWVFYAGRTVKLFRRDERSQAIDHLTSQPGSCLITTQQHFDTLRPQLPATVHIVDRVPYFLKDEELVLVRHAELVRRKPRSVSEGTR